MVVLKHSISWCSLLVVMAMEHSNVGLENKLSERGTSLALTPCGKQGLSYGLHIIECESTFISPDFDENFLNSPYLNNRLGTLVCFFSQPCEVGGLALMQQRTSSNLARRYSGEVEKHLRFLL